MYVAAYPDEGPLEKTARIMAMTAHWNQRRKYTNDPYIVHPAAVVGLVRSVPHTEEMLAAAWLHDVVEDCNIDILTIVNICGDMVGHMVAKLTGISKKDDGNRKTRKRIDREWIETSGPDVKTVKLCDLIDNTISIMAHDHNFAKVYLKEKRELLEVLRDGDPTLWAKADKICREAGY